jgi:hypothetical protein
MISHLYGVSVAVNTHYLRKKTFTQNGLTVLFLLADYLQQDAASDICICLFVDDGEIHPVCYEIPDIGQCDVAAFIGVVQTPVGIFLDDSGCTHTFLLLAGAGR